MLEDELKDKFLNPSNVLPWDLLDLVQSVPQQSKPELYDMLTKLPGSISRTKYRSKRRGINCSIVEFSEELNAADLRNAQSSTSISLNRKYAANESSLRGNTSNLPFKPGGISMKNDSGVSSDTAKLHRDDDGLFDIAQGLSRGLKLSHDDDDDKDDIGKSLKEVEKLDESQEDLYKDEDKDDVDKLTTSLDLVELNDEKDLQTKTNNAFEKDIDELLPVDINFGRAHKQDTQLPLVQKQKDWAHVVDLDHKIEDFDDLIPNMARTWPFELDTFQQEAVYHLEQGDSVFVAAHTSAGKTVIAEYAIAMANRNMTKAIYTSPIKALSNQKFRDFKQDFEGIDVGLITGDVQINPEANCLIMTTEILRSMLYRGADLIRDVEFVIFDEVHYVNDIDRGVVWEEVIIMLPDHVKFILLSATVPNTFEFANWVGRTKHKNIYVISTPKRPVPLEISVWAKKKLIKLIDANRTFQDKNFNEYLDLYETNNKPGDSKSSGANAARGGRGGARGGARGGSNTGRGGARGGANAGRGGARGGGASGGNGRRFNQVSRPNKTTWIELVQYLNTNSLLPAVIFVFSKKRCEEYANTLTGVDFCNAKEKSQIHMFIDKAVSRLKKEDRELPQIISIRDMLSRGIAVHHGGLLPIVKEVIEILFAKTLIKVLFATETFAMGLNLPTRTVVFSELRKHDGVNFRDLLPGEFTQMSGRAGRRGLDKIGTVIVMSYTEPLSRLTFKDVTLGTPTKLVSQFRLTYNMILNLLRIEALRVEEMIKHSFSENTSQTMLPEHERQVKKLEEDLKALPPLEIEDAVTIEELQEAFDDLIEYKKLTESVTLELLKNPVTAKRLRPGRFLVFKDAAGITKLGVLVKLEASTNTTAAPLVSVLTFNVGKSERETPTGLPFITQIPKFINTHFTKMIYEGDLKIVQIPLTNIEMVCRASSNTDIFAVLRSNQEAINQLKDQIGLFLRFQTKWQEHTESGGFASANLFELQNARNKIIEKLKNTPVLNSVKFGDYFRTLNKEYSIKKEIEHFKSLMSDENLELLPNYEQRLEVLKELEFVDNNLNVVMKGRVACEINSGWELVLTELILDNFLGDFEPEEIVALLSAFVYEGRSSEEEESKITPRLEKGKDKILEIMGNIIDVYNKHQVTLTSEEETFFERKRFALVNVVYEWARGLTFKEIMELSVEAEGTIVRVITRLDEICREVKSAALIIGDSSLHSKMTIAQEQIKRDIVFCASLYL